MGLKNFFSKKERRETIENKVTPLTSENWEGFFSREETEIKVGKQVYNISLGEEENRLSNERVITLSNEYGIVIGQIKWDGESLVSSEIGKDYGKGISILHTVSEYLNKEIPLQYNKTRTQNGIMDTLNIGKK